MSRPLRMCISSGCVLLLTLSFLFSTIATNKSMLTWPIAAPTRVAGSEVAYTASGWQVSSGFGWRPNPDIPTQYEWHDGIDLAGPMFCLGCGIPPMGDVVIARAGWDREWADDPLWTGLGVVVDMDLQHSEEAGVVRLRYGHLQPYAVYVRTRSCTQTVDCPQYHLDGAASVAVSCQGRVIEVGSGQGEQSFVYATPGQCTATVSWPDEYMPQGSTTLRFDQRIAPGMSSQNAALTFDAELPPPPPLITPTAMLPLPTPPAP